MRRLIDERGVTTDKVYAAAKPLLFKDKTWAFCKVKKS
ncbi:Uncharacterised protein [Neisseria animaloris]|uniref:Uncharacterized protein n=1 Tax=Neisseria animaloris TaxID=326522 RepID=A0A3S5BV51_9NEIS|nr:Uncharacterised protein [Neisseria animaloris]